jgi:hypothetical protein
MLRGRPPPTLDDDLGAVVAPNWGAPLEERERTRVLRLELTYRHAGRELRPEHRVGNPFGSGREADEELELAVAGIGQLAEHTIVLEWPGGDQGGTRCHERPHRDGDRADVPRTPVLGEQRPEIDRADCDGTRRERREQVDRAGTSHVDVSGHGRRSVCDPAFCGLRVGGIGERAARVRGR